MIPLLVRDLRWRLLFLAVAALLLGWQEWETQAHAPVEAAVELGPLGLSAPASYLAGFAVIVLLAGFISTDRREGYTRLFFSHPTRPSAFYGVRWALAVALSLALAVLFLVLFQVAVWGELRGGGAGLGLVLANVLVYGGLMAFLSAALPRGDAWVAFFLFFSTLVPGPLNFLLSIVGSGVRQLLLFVLPPHSTTLQRLYESALEGSVAWDALLFSAGYGAVWLVAAGVVLSIREWS